MNNAVRNALSNAHGSASGRNRRLGLLLAGMVMLYIGAVIAFIIAY